MHILLVAATTFEIQPTIDSLLQNAAGPALSAVPSRSPSPSPSPSPFPGPPHRFSTLITGVGSLPTAWSLIRQIDRDRPDLVIQAGIAGCFTHHPAGTVLAIEEEGLGDLGVWEDQQFKTLFDLKLANADQFPFSAGKLVCPYQRLLTLTALEQVTGITVNEITTHPDRIRWYQQNTPAVVESMEGGALHYVCLQEKVPFLQLRSVSNPIGVRDKTKWAIPLAIARLNDQLIKILQQLNKEDETILSHKITQP